MLPKRVLRPDRLRRVPAQFSWIDQRLVREGYIRRCGHAALALYLFLLTVADREGLSYYAEPDPLGERLHDAVDIASGERGSRRLAALGERDEDRACHDAHLSQVVRPDLERLGRVGADQESRALGGGLEAPKADERGAVVLRLDAFEPYAAARHVRGSDQLASAGHEIASGEHQIIQQTLGKGYLVVSWYAILAGMGIFPDRRSLRSPTAAEARYSLAAIDDLLERSAANYRDHRAVLEDIPPRRTGALQVYLWV
jgi:hypothetical protein